MAAEFEKTVRGYDPEDTSNQNEKDWSVGLVIREGSQPTDWPETKF